MHRWPWPAWKRNGGGTLKVGPYQFWFVDLSNHELVWWAHQVRRGSYEQHVIRQVTRALKPGDVFFDLGAHVGQYSLLASRLVGDTGRVVAFEPDPRTRGVLERNLAANDAENVTVAPFAVGRTTGTVRFVASGNSAGMVDARGDVDVRQITLDEYCAEREIRPGVMKVDIEGGEAAALLASDVARAARELIVEVHVPQLVAQGVDPDAFLRDLGEYQHLGLGNYAVKPRAAA
jgi:FkbM family methyltransferase